MHKDNMGPFHIHYLNTERLSTSEKLFLDRSIKILILRSYQPLKIKGRFLMRILHRVSVPGVFIEFYAADSMFFLS